MRNELTLPTSFSGQELSLTLDRHCTTYLAVECRWSVGSRPRPETGGGAWRWGGSCRQIQVGGASGKALCSKATSRLHHYLSQHHATDRSLLSSTRPVPPPPTGLAPRTSSSGLLRYAQTLPAVQLLRAEEGPQILLGVAGLQPLCGKCWNG